MAFSCLFVHWASSEKLFTESIQKECAEIVGCHIKCTDIVKKSINSYNKSNGTTSLEVAVVVLGVFVCL